MNYLRALLLIVAVFTMIFFITRQSKASLIGGQDIIAPPSSVEDDFPGAENYHQQAFNEKQGVLLPSYLQVDGGFISAGTTVSSHMIFFNTPGNTSGMDFLVDWQFDGDILGVMSDGYGNLEAASNAILGAPGPTYPGSFDARGMDGGFDIYSFSGDTITVSMMVYEPGDWIRVVTNHVPIPGAIWVLGSGLIVLAGLRKRLKK